MVDIIRDMAYDEPDNMFSIGEFSTLFSTWRFSVCPVLPLLGGSPSVQFFLYLAVLRLSSSSSTWRFSVCPVLPANSIAHGGLVLAYSANTSKIIMKRSGLSAGPWCNLIFASKYSVLSHLNPNWMFQTPQ